MVTAKILDAMDPMTKQPIYPIKANIWDFIASIHAMMSVGEDKEQDPQIVFVGNSSHETSRAERYNPLVNKALTRSRIDFHSLFWNVNVYGAYALVIRYDRSRRFPIYYEPIPSTDFFPVLDSAGRVIEFFVFREISHSEAKWLYGVSIPESRTPYYIEYWNPEQYEVRVNSRIAYASTSKGKKVIAGRNIFGVAPAVYIPHVRKQNKYGDSQLLDTKQPGLEFNARFADVSDGVRDQMSTQYVGANIKSPRKINVGGQVIWNIGETLDKRGDPQIEALTNSSGINDANNFVDSLWDLFTTISFIPPIAMGVDEGSQRSSLTLRTRFWLLNSHCGLERRNVSQGLQDLAHMTIVGLSQLRYPGVTTDGLSLHVRVNWPEMLPEDRLELLNEAIQRFTAGIISRKRAIEMFGDVENVTEEEAEIDADAKRKQDEAIAMQKAQAAIQPKEPSKSKEK